MNEDGSVLAFHAILSPVRSEGQNTRTLLTYWWEGFDAPFREGFRLGTTNADLKRLKEVIERYATQDTPRWYPYGSFYDEAFAELNESRAGRQDRDVHVPTFAQSMLKRLLDVGLLHTREDEV